MAGPPTHRTRAALTGRPKIQPLWVVGKRERVRLGLFALKLAVFLGLPWLSVGGAPALYFDVPTRRYHVFGATFWPQDFYMLGLVLAIAAVLLFVTTSLVGRIFCGFACPHTLMTTLFMALERAVEGPRHQRLAADGGKGGWKAKGRRALKHVVYVLAALVLGFTFVSYFTGAWPLLQSLLAGRMVLPVAALGAFVAGVIYLFAGHLREWVCLTVCPYGRFQGAMQDQHTKMVTYDASRGEKRGNPKAPDRGDCVDCGLCVVTCPTGIDIREGWQYDCIGCMRCMDACDQTMAKWGQPGGLIRLLSATEVEKLTPRADRAETPEVEAPARRHPGIRIRARHVWYAAVLGGLVGLLATLVATRPLVVFSARREPTAAFATASGGGVNLYRFTVGNKDHRMRRFTLEALEPDLMLSPVAPTFALEPGGIASATVSARRRAGGSGAPKPVRFALSEDGVRVAVLTATFSLAGARSR